MGPIIEIQSQIQNLLPQCISTKSTAAPGTFLTKPIQFALCYDGFVMRENIHEKLLFQSFSSADTACSPKACLVNNGPSSDHLSRKRSFLELLLIDLCKLKQIGFLIFLMNFYKNSNFTYLWVLFKHVCSLSSFKNSNFLLSLNLVMVPAGSGRSSDLVMVENLNLWHQSLPDSRDCQIFWAAVSVNAWVLKPLMDHYRKKIFILYAFYILILEYVSRRYKTICNFELNYFQD